MGLNDSFGFNVEAEPFATTVSQAKKSSKQVQKNRGAGIVKPAGSRFTVKEALIPIQKRRRR
jgi:hypothetical protein